LVELTISPQRLGTEPFTLFIQSNADPKINVSFTISFSVSDDDAVAPTILIQYIGNYTDASPGFLYVEAFDSSGLSIDPSGVYQVIQSFDPQYFEFLAVDNDNDRPEDQLQQTESITITLYDDDATPPFLTGLSLVDDLQEVTLQLEITDQSGVSPVQISVDGALIEPLFQSQEGNTWRFILQNDWIMEEGTHSVNIVVWDADNDRFNDSLSSSLVGYFETTFHEMRQFVLWEVDQLNEAVQLSPDECWSGPVVQRKSAMSNKLIELKEFIGYEIFEGKYADAYDKLLHDIKPKLTGLKTDENEIPWSNGLFKNPWVICPALQETFRMKSNQILMHIILFLRGISKFESL